ncbi:MAG: ankyrin repeat domain-containing protein [Flavobacterium sp.]
MENIFQIIRDKSYDTFFSSITNSNINIVNENKQNLLQESISFENYLTANFLIENDIDLNHQDSNGKTSLHYCASFNNYSIAEKILAKNGNINICDSFGNNPLWVAVFSARGEYGLVKLFLQYGADINSKNKNNKSPLDFAMQISDELLINILVRR